MIEIGKKEKCCGCAACMQVCPKQCISMVPDMEGFLYPRVNYEECVACNLCKKVCPMRNATQEKEKKILAYAAYNKNEEERLKSSSGGIFTLLAKQTLLMGGVVFGAVMSEDCCSVYHVAVESIDKLEKLQGSKYLQSEIRTTYIQAKQQLDLGRKVLYSGTPCEIEGLKAFLRKEYKNLICVDLICHGVPSQKVWEKYIHFREKRAGAIVQQTFFRNKNLGWKMFAVLFEFANNTAYKQVFNKDLFMQMFLQNLCLRPSCYECAFKKKHRESDITLADFWGCQDICPEMDDNKGLSAILIHSEKGKEEFQMIQSKLQYQQVKVDEILGGNPSLVNSCRKPEMRDAFMADLDRLSFKQLEKKYVLKPTIKDVIKNCMIKLKEKMPRKFVKICKCFLGKGK